MYKDTHTHKRTTKVYIYYFQYTYAYIYIYDKYIFIECNGRRKFKVVLGGNNFQMKKEYASMLENQRLKTTSELHYRSIRVA